MAVIAAVVLSLLFLVPCWPCSGWAVSGATRSLSPGASSAQLDWRYPPVVVLMVSGRPSPLSASLHLFRSFVIGKHLGMAERGPGGQDLVDGS
jgi:hypothetical protein